MVKYLETAPLVFLVEQGFKDRLLMSRKSQKGNTK